MKKLLGLSCIIVPCLLIFSPFLYVLGFWFTLLLIGVAVLGAILSATIVFGINLLSE